jgi:alpha-L-fucosidase
VLGLGEQILWRDLMPLQEYEPRAMDFKPAADWADRLAAQAVAAGMKYVVLTTRHHDGYCLFNTATHKHNAVRTGPDRDLVAEYVAACRKHGLLVGFYYSLLTWRWKGFWSPAQYPQDLDGIVAEVHAQVRELMANYGAMEPGMTRRAIAFSASRCSSTISETIRWNWPIWRAAGSRAMWRANCASA